MYLETRIINFLSAVNLCKLWYLLCRGSCSESFSNSSNNWEVMGLSLVKNLVYSKGLWLLSCL